MSFGYRSQLPYACQDMVSWCSIRNLPSMVRTVYMDRMLYTDIFDTTIRSLSKKIADCNIWLEKDYLACKITFLSSQLKLVKHNSVFLKFHLLSCFSFLSTVKIRSHWMINPLLEDLMCWIWAAKGSQSKIDKGRGGGERASFFATRHCTRERDSLLLNCC